MFGGKIDRTLQGAETPDKEGSRKTTGFTGPVTPATPRQHLCPQLGRPGVALATRANAQSIDSVQNSF